MKKGKILWMAVLAALVLVPTMGWAIPPTGLPATETSFFTEIYAGGGFASTSKNVLRGVSSPFLGGNRDVQIPGNISPYFIPGVKLGYWFSPDGTFGISSLPSWMSYLGVYTDFSYQKLDFGHQSGNFTTGAGQRNSFTFSTQGNVFTWAFMLAARYGFMPDSEVPFGRLQPYIAAGPAIYFNNQTPTLNNITPFNVGNFQPGFSISPGSKNSVEVGAAVEAGLRYFFNKSISAEASFKYRLATFNKNFDSNIPGTNLTVQSDTNASINLFSGQIGVAYHF